jgi:hypothetical protein
MKQKEILTEMQTLIELEEALQIKLKEVETTIYKEEMKSPLYRFLTYSKEHWERQKALYQRLHRIYCSKYNMLRLEQMNYPLGELKPEFFNN